MKKKSQSKKKSPEKSQGILYPAHGFSLDEGETFITMESLKELEKKEKKNSKL